MIVLATSVLSCVSQMATAQGNLVFNGGFDTDASGWTITNVYVPYGGGYTSSSGNPAGSVFLYNPDFGVIAPTASQEINGLTAGDIYIVSGDYRGGGKNVTSNSFGVAFDGVFLFETNAPPIYANWYSFSFDYTPPSTSALLSLSSQINGTDGAYYIDNISIQLVPEPSSEILLGFGGILLLGFGRWKMKQVAY